MATVFFGKILQSFYSNDKFVYDSILGKLEKKTRASVVTTEVAFLSKDIKDIIN